MFTPELAKELMSLADDHMDSDAPNTEEECMAVEFVLSCGFELPELSEGDDLSNSDGHEPAAGAGEC